jgi:hypothetical protein
MELNLSEATSHSATHELPNILWKPSVHYHGHKILPLVQDSATSPCPEPDESNPYYILFL